MNVMMTNPLEETRKILKDVHFPFKKDSFITAFFMGRTEYVTEKT